MKRRLFAKNAAILTITSLILRTVGIVFRIFLSGKIGAEGMGLYQLIISIYVLGSTFATSGISTAVTRLVADELVRGTPRSIRHILRRSLLLSVLIGAASTLLIFFGAEWIGAKWIGDMRAVSALKMLSLSLPSMGVSSCLKGYFAARRRVSHSSVAQLLEQAVRIVLIFLIIDRFAAQGLASACLAVMIGDTAAEWTSCAYIALSYFRDRRRLEKEADGLVGIRANPSVVRQLLAIAGPITAGRYLNTVLRTVENILVPSRIALYCGSQEVGLSQFGALKGMALPLIFFPASFLSAMSSLLIPELSAANVRSETASINRMVEKSLHITTISSLLIAAVFTVFSKEIGFLLYNSRDVGLYLLVLAPLTPIMYTESMVDGMLKGLGQQVSSLKYSVVDSALRILLIWLIVPRHGMAGFLLIMVVSNLLTSFLNLNRLLTVTALKPRWSRLLIKPLFAALFAATTAVTVTPLLRHLPLPNVIITVLGAALLCAIYLVLIFALDCVDKRDFSLDRLPKKRYDC